MALKFISFRVTWTCACDPDAYHGFNLAITLCNSLPNSNPIEQVYVKPPYSSNGVYSYDVVNYTYDDTLCYDIWVQAVTYSGKESMWRSLKGVEVPDDSGTTFLSTDLTQEEFADLIEGQTIDGTSTDINNVDGGNIQNGTVGSNQISTNSITSNHIQANSITSNHIQANSITSNHIQANSINSDHIQTNTINSGHIQANSIISTHISSSTITSDHIQAHIIKAGNIEAGTITAAEIASSTITADKIASSTITATQIAANTITAGNVNANSLFSVSAEVTGTLSVTGSGQISLGNGNILASGSITAASGTVGGWIISSDKIESDVGAANRITLDKTKSRISIVSDTSATKVAMGYLNGLPKNDGSGDYTVADYGFYAAPGDTLHIDGDAEYTSGDWIIQHDSAYLIKDSSGKTIVRLGSDSGTHGVHIYNTLGVKLAEYSSSKILIGTESGGTLTSGLRYTLAGGLELVGSMTVYAGDVVGLGTLATMDVTDLGTLATMNSVSDSNITSISGGKISTGTIALNSGGTSVRINNAGKISFYPSTTEKGYITTNASNAMELNSSGRILIDAVSLIQVNSGSSINFSGTTFYIGSAATVNGNLTISGTRTLTGSSTSVSVSSVAASGAVSASGNVFGAGLVVGSYGMEVGNGQPKRLTTRSVNASYIDFDYSGGYIKIAANGGAMVNAVAYSSDYRLKENITPLEQESIISLMDSVQPYRFNFIGESKEEYGVLAQDLAEIFPECVCEMHEGYYGVNYHMLTTLLIDCVRNLNARVKELEAT